MSTLTDTAVKALTTLNIPHKMLGKWVELFDMNVSRLAEIADVNEAAKDVTDDSLESYDAFMWRAIPGLKEIQDYKWENGCTEQEARIALSQVA